MPLNELAVPERVVGEKEVRRAMAEGRLRKVFVASDTEEKRQRTLLEEAKSAGIEVERVDLRSRLGRACAIDRPAAVAGLLKR
ncbi:MAG: 50S ribosomal protein L7ae [Fretibacterium sp.]|nr:50S ribosomal protein L7ae [Fretibacterium sp.]